jgi:hypothetical protein
MRQSTNKRAVQPKFLMPPERPPVDYDETLGALVGQQDTNSAYVATTSGNRRPGISRRLFPESASLRSSGFLPVGIQSDPKEVLGQSRVERHFGTAVVP